MCHSHGLHIDVVQRAKIGPPARIQSRGDKPKRWAGIKRTDPGALVIRSWQAAAALVRNPPFAIIGGMRVTNWGRLPAELKEISPLVPYPVQISASLEQLAAVTDQRTGLPELQP